MNAPVRFESTPPEGVRWHDYANLFPMHAGDAHDSLREDIRQHGVREPIVFLAGAILDGRNRYMAARDLGLDYPRREFGSLPADGDDPLAFVVSLNLARRHLSESQRANVAARLANMGHGQRADYAGDRPADLPLLGEAVGPAPVTQADAAKLMNVSERMVRAAKHVQADAPPEIVQAVDDGRLSVSLAAQVADLPEEVQAEIVAAPPEEIKAEAKAQVANYRAQGTGQNEWFTPAEYAALAREVLGTIDLDPASCAEANEVIQATDYFTKDDDGLAHAWTGRVWLNPPYSRDLMPAFCEKLAAHVEAGEVTQAILVSHNNTETAWFQRLAGVCSALCFPSKRIRFYRGDEVAGPVNGQVFIYFGADPEAFIAAFRPVGFVVVPA